MSDPEVLQRATLLEGTPFEKELAVLPFRTKKFPGIFRDTKINVAVDLLTGQNVSYRPRMDSHGLSATSEAFTPRTNSPYTPVFSPGGGIPQLDGQTLAHRLPHLRTNSLTSSGNSSESGVNSWATVAKSSSSLPFTNLIRKEASFEPPKAVLRNLKGHRVDETLDYDRDEVQRLKKLKMCNQHYIGNGCCHYNANKANKCPHRHDVKLTQQERYWLRVVARETPCKKGFECDDVKCIYGHRCPFPLATEGTMRGSGMCLNGENCRFSQHMHGVDTKIVKRTLITGAF